MQYSRHNTINVTDITNEVDFTENCLFFVLENKGKEPVEIYLKDKLGAYNSTPVIIGINDEPRLFNFATDVFQHASDSPGRLQYFAVFGDSDTPGNLYDIYTINHNNTFPKTLQTLQQDNLIRHATLVLTEEFDGDLQLELGFIGEQDAIFGVTEVKINDSDYLFKPQQFSPYRISQAIETLTLFRAGSATQGSFLLILE